MALSTSIDWDIRGGVGNDNNGGGYKRTAGTTDYSLQAAAQLALTDLATSGTGITTLTSVTGGFTAAMVGNVINIVSGTNLTAGLYEVTAYTDTNTVTLDSAPDDGVGGVSAGVGNLGGSLTTIAVANAIVVSGQRMWVKSATYTEAVSLAAGIGMYGYGTIHGDTPKGDDRPLIDGESARAGIIFANSVGITVHSFRVTGSTGSGLSGIRNANLFNVKSYSNASSGATNSYQRGVNFTGCDLSNNTSQGFNNSSDTYPNFTMCNISNNTGQGCDANSINSEECVFASNGGSGMYGSTSGTVARLCTFYNNTGDGINVNGTIGIIINCTSSDNSGDGFDADEISSFFGYNQVDGNGGLGVTAGISDSIFYDSATMTTGDPKLNDPGNGDFTLQTDSSCIDAGCDVGTWTGATT